MKALPDTTGGDTISSGNWIIDNLNSSLETWNSKLSEIWTLLTTSPENFKGGGIWNVIVGINDALKAIAYALLVLFFVIGVMKTCGSFTELNARRCHSNASSVLYWHRRRSPTAWS